MLACVCFSSCNASKQQHFIKCRSLLLHISSHDQQHTIFETWYFSFIKKEVYRSSSAVKKVFLLPYNVHDWGNYFNFQWKSNYLSHNPSIIMCWVCRKKAQIRGDFLAFLYSLWILDCYSLQGTGVLLLLTTHRQNHTASSRVKNETCFLRDIICTGFRYLRIGEKNRGVFY